ncbi:MAG: HlyD family type I secretion periplasmic adaptor subunit [Magnetococcus sp. MYC-9]
MTVRKSASNPTLIRVMADMGNVRESGAPALVRDTVGLIAGSLVVGLVWAGMAHVKEVAHVPGQVVPTQSVQTVQHLEGGVVAEVLVQDNQRVEKEQLLLRMDKQQSVPEREQTLLHARGLEARALRLRAFLTEGEAGKAYLKTLQKEPLYAEQWEIYQNQRISLRDNLAALDSQIAQRQADIDQARGDLQAAYRQWEVSGELVKIRKELLDQQAISRLVYLETLRTHITAQGEIERFKKQIENMQGALQEVQQRRRKTIADAHQVANDELAAIVNELAQVKETLTRIEDRVVRTDVRAPVRGIVQELKVHTPGTVVQSGELLMRIVPVDETGEESLEVEVRIPPNEIGRVTSGQTVVVKFSSYEFSHFGTVSGRLVTLSPSVLRDDQGNPYYRGGVVLNSRFVGGQPGVNPIQTGMQTQVDILLGEKSILRGLAAALSRSVSGGFNER